MILLVNQYITSVFLDVCNAFARKGETSVLCGSIAEGGTKPDRGLHIIDSIRYRRHTAFWRLATWLGFSLHLFWYLLLRKPRAVVVSTNPPIAPWVVGWLCRLKGIPYHVVLYDLYPEAFLQVGMLKPKNFIYKFWQRRNTTCFRKAAKVITLSESMKQAALPYVDAGSMVVIHNWVNAEHIRPVPRHENPFVAKLGLMSKLVVLYSGNMGLTHDLQSLVQAAGDLGAMNDIEFIIIGEGAQRDRLMASAKGSEGNIHFLPYQREEEFPFAMAAADIGIVTLGQGAEGISVPSKTYVNLAAGLALLVIAPAASELSRLVETAQAGFTIPPGHPELIREKILQFHSDRALLSTLKENARKAALQFTPANAELYVSLVLGTDHG